MSDFVKISEGGEKVESGKGGVSSYNGEKTGTVVPLNQSVREASSIKIKTSDGESQVDEGKGVRVTVGGEGSGLDVRDRHDRPVSDPRKYTDDCSIRVGSTRCTIKQALDLGLLAVDGQGNFSVPEDGYQKALGKGESTQESATPRESFVTATDQAQLNAIHSRVSPDVMNSYMNNIISSMMTGKSAEVTVADMAQAVGAEPKSLANWTESYINNMMGQALDAVVRNSSGQLTSDDVWNHLDKCSSGFKTQLLLGLHLGSNSMIHQLIKVVKSGSIV